MKQQRLENLADGIFAIVMTLLVLELKVPDLPASVTSDGVMQALRGAGAPLLAYILSFAILFTYWRAHNYIVSSLARNIDSWLSNINALFLLLVGLVPFTTYVLGQYHYTQAAIYVYGLNVIAIGLALYWLRRYIKTSQSIDNAPITKAEDRRGNIRVLMPVVLALVAITISFWNTNASFIIFTIAIGLNLFPTSARLINWLLNLFDPVQEDLIYED